VANACVIKHNAMAWQGEEAVTSGFKWLRAVGDMENTGLHMDRIFVRGSDRLLTVWIPLGDVPVEQGSLLVC
jgi:ectoine hydroxylase-related dioxygenase (phytanoyl-CoA dioxygenase family)